MRETRYVMLSISKKYTEYYILFSMQYLFNTDYFLGLLKPAAGSTKPSTKGVTFRLSTGKLEKLRKAANSRVISPNTLFNQILKSYLEWYSLAAPAKLYYLPKSFLVRLLDELTDDELDELARDTAKNELVDICLYLRGGFNITSISEIAETWLKIAQMPHRVEVTRDIYKIIIEHDMGHKYSFLIKEISRNLLEVAFQTKSSCEITENAVIIKIWQ
jgi:hypothetical protein